MPNLGVWEIIAIVVVIVLLFGAKRLPDAARSLGRSMRIFKSEVKEIGNDDKGVEQRQIEAQQPPVQPQPIQQPSQVVNPDTTTQQ